MLLRHFRGADLPVPKTFKPDSLLAQRLGADNAQALSDYMGGGRLSIPSRHPAQRFVEELRVKMLVEDGLSGPEIATELGISSRQVRRIKARLGISGLTYCRGPQKVNRPRLGEVSPPKSLPAPSESVFNGGLTGVSASFAALDPSEASFAAQCVIQTAYGIYSPQPKKDTP